MRVYTSKSLEERFWPKVEKLATEAGCWIWTAALDGKGYGVMCMKVAGRHKLVRAHRVAFYLDCGRWPEPETIHSCDVRPCVNPVHLSEGTRRDNWLDCVAKGRNRYGLPTWTDEMRRLAAERLKARPQWPNEKRLRANERISLAWTDERRAALRARGALTRTGT